MAVAAVLVAGSLISGLNFGTRSVFGLFLPLMTVDMGWSRETFAFAMALQNLVWGLFMPVAGAFADRFGYRMVLGGGAIVYALGIWGMTLTDAPAMLHLFGGILVGSGVAFTAFSLAIVAMVKVVGADRRSLVMGLGTAAGSMGQVLFSPVTQGFIANYGWHDSLLILSLFPLMILPLAFVLPKNPNVSGSDGEKPQMRATLLEAAKHRGYFLLTSGFFVCGFHVAFITVHMPAYVADLGLAAEVGAYSIALIGLFNIFGSFLSGWAGQVLSKKFSLSFIYFSRAIVILGLILLPKTAMTIYVFSSFMGLLWLATVPLTTGIVSQIFGVRYLATLFGIVFLGHQLGSFIGVWAGGWIHTHTGSYLAMWWAGIVLGLLAALIHVPINEKPLERLRAAMA